MTRGHLTSPAFEISRQLLNFLLGGGSGRSGTGHYARPNSWSTVRSSAPRPARTDGIVNWKNWDVVAIPRAEKRSPDQDQATGGWGHLTFDHTVFSGLPPRLLAVLRPPSTWLVDGQIVRTATGSNSETLDWVNWDLRDLAR